MKAFQSKWMFTFLPRFFHAVTSGLQKNALEWLVRTDECWGGGGDDGGGRAPQPPPSPSAPPVAATRSNSSVDPEDV